jgi:hypothetical protein
MAEQRWTPSNPAELASQRAFEAAQSDSWDMMAGDERLLAELDYAADSLGFLGTEYWVTSHRGMAVPVSYKVSEPVRIGNFMDVEFVGRLATYSKVHVGKLIGAGSVRAVCLTFEDATLWTSRAMVPANHLFHVPVLAIESMEPVST